MYNEKPEAIKIKKKKDNNLRAVTSLTDDELNIPSQLLGGLKLFFFFFSDLSFSVYYFDFECLDRVPTL